MRLTSLLAFAMVFLFAFSLFGCLGDVQNPSDDVYPPNKTATPPDDVYPPNKTNVSVIPVTPVNFTPSNVSICNWQSPSKSSLNPGKLSYKTNVSVDAIAISQYGWRAVAGAQDYKIYYFKQDSSEPYFVYKTGGQVNTVSMADTGMNFVAGSRDGKIYYFECDEKIPKWIYNTKQDDGSGPAVQSVDITRDGKWIAAVSKSHFYLFNSSQNIPVINLDLSKSVWSLATVDISDDGSAAVVGSIPDGTNGQIFYIDLNAKKLLWQYNMTDLGWASGVPIPVAISFYGYELAAGGPDNQIHFWKSDSATPVWTYKITDESAVYSVSLSADSTKLAATGYSRLFYFDSTISNKTTMTYDGYYKDLTNKSRTGSWDIGNYLHAVDLSHDASTLVAGDYVYGHFFVIEDGSASSVKMYDLAYDVDPVGAVKTSSDGSWVIASSTFYGEVLRFQLN